MDQRDEQVKRIVLTAVEECTICGQTFDLENIDVLGRRGDLWVLTLCCAACENRGFVAALLIDEQAIEPDMAVKLSAEAATGFDQAEPVSARDVLEMHEFLAGFEGDLGAHLRARRTP